jgi:hypothetical protein
MHRSTLSLGLTAQVRDLGPVVLLLVLEWSDGDRLDVWGSRRPGHVLPLLTYTWCLVHYDLPLSAPHFFAENELSILEFIHMIVETFDSYFEGVCELDIMFNVEKAHMILDEVVSNGEIVETNRSRILAPVRYRPCFVVVAVLARGMIGGASRAASIPAWDGSQPQPVVDVSHVPTV